VNLGHGPTSLPLGLVDDMVRLPFDAQGKKPCPDGSRNLDAAQSAGNRVAEERAVRGRLTAGRVRPNVIPQKKY